MKTFRVFLATALLLVTGASVGGQGPVGPVGPWGYPGGGWGGYPYLVTNELDPADVTEAAVTAQPEERGHNGDCDCGDNCAEGNRYQKGTE